MVEDTQITKTTESPPTKPKKLKPKQKLTIDNWLSPDSETFGNLYRSAIKAGFKHTYALNLTSLKPLWLSETLDQQILDPEHIKQGVQAIATNPNLDSRSPADTNLKAYELLGRYAGLDNNGKGNTVNLFVQPILGGASVPTREVVDATPDGLARK